MSTTRLQQQRQGTSCKAVSSLDPRLVPSQSVPTGLPAHRQPVGLERLFRGVRLQKAGQYWMAVPSEMYFSQTELLLTMLHAKTKLVH